MSNTCLDNWAVQCTAAGRPDPDGHLQRGARHWLCGKFSNKRKIYFTKKCWVLFSFLISIGDRLWKMRDVLNSFLFLFFLILSKNAYTIRGRGVMDCPSTQYQSSHIQSDSKQICLKNLQLKGLFIRNQYQPFK